MLTVETGELLIVRFAPMRLDALMDAATLSADECLANGTEPIYSISTFGLVKGVSDTTESLILRICEEAPCSGKTVWLATDTQLLGAGFEIRLSEPPQHHYDVILGHELRETDVEKLVSLFEPGRERNPAWKRSR